MDRVRGVRWGAFTLHPLSSRASDPRSRTTPTPARIDRSHGNPPATAQPNNNDMLKMKIALALVAACLASPAFAAEGDFTYGANGLDWDGVAEECGTGQSQSPIGKGKLVTYFYAYVESVRGLDALK